MPQAESHVQGLRSFLTLDLTRGYSLMQPITVCAAPKGRVLRRFGLKNGQKLCPFWSGSGIVFEGTTGMYEHIYRFNSK